MNCAKRSLTFSDWNLCMVCQQVLAAQRLKRANFEKPPGGQHPWQPVRESPQSPVAWFQTCGQLLHSVFGTCTWYAVQLKGNLLQILSQFWELLLLKPSLNPNPRMVGRTCQQEFTQHDSRMESFKSSADRLPYTFCSNRCFLDKIQGLATSRTLPTQLAKPGQSKL